MASSVESGDFDSELDENETTGKIRLRMVRASHEEITAVLLECLRYLAGDNVPEGPHFDLDILACWGLDSEHGVELACDLSTRLNIKIPHDENPLIDESSGTKRSRTIGEVVEYLAQCAAKAAS